MIGNSRMCVGLYLLIVDEYSRGKSHKEKYVALSSSCNKDSAIIL